MRTLLVFSCLLLACATAEPIATPAPPPAPTRLEASPRQAPPFDARSFAANQLTPLECEKGARQLYEIRPDQGWAALVACVDRTRWPRGEFTHLELLTRGVWDQELQTRPEAPRLIAKVVALRGGDVEGDLPLVQKSRVPLFTLAAALRQPDVYKGRWVLVRGALTEIKQEGNRAAAMMRETSLRATAREVADGPIHRYESSYSGKGQGEYSSTSRTSNSGGSSSRTDNKASGSGSYSSSGRSEYSSVKQRFENERVETGRRAVGKLAQADPFLEPEKDFLFLARFDGVNPGQNQEPVAMLSIAGYFQPNALLIQ
ncbi:MAG TPA: hypothetical protein VEP66_11410 [Myxococcales bacterium]|nr:hypothetical protein [Myxococcales bacterium]